MTAVGKIKNNKKKTLAFSWESLVEILLKMALNHHWDMQRMYLDLLWYPDGQAINHILLQHWLRWYSVLYLQPGSLDDILQSAIMLNRKDFIELFLDNGVSLKDFLTLPRLVQLYNQVQSNMPMWSPLFSSQLILFLL